MLYNIAELQQVTRLCAVRAMNVVGTGSMRRSLVSGWRMGTRMLATGVCRRGTFEPDYLDSSGPVIPTYPPVNIQVKGENQTLL